MIEIKPIITMFRAFLLFALFLTGTIQSFANNNPQEIIANHSSELGLYYIHQLHKKETVYSLSKFTNTSVQEIYDLNGINKNNVLSVGQKLRIPIEATAVLQTKKSVAGHKLVKVYYRVKKKDNLFQIAKRYFQTEVNTIRQLNNLQDLTISPGQLLHLGWMSVPNNVTIERIESEVIMTAPAVNTAAMATVPAQGPTSTQSTYQQSQPVRTTTVYQQSEHVASTSSSAEDVKHQYRVVQHTPLKNAQSASTEVQTSQVSTNTTVTKPKEIKKEVAVSQASVQVTAPVYQQSTTVVTTAPAQTKVITTPQTTVQPAVQETAVVTTVPKTTMSTKTTASAQPITNTTSVTTSKYAVTKRDYPDLSFLSDPSLQVEKAVASWDKTDNEPLNMFVLHHSAKINSYVRVENPMLGRIALAKVIGRLPNNIQDPQIKMIVSTAVANSLGVKDEKFLTEIKFIQ